MSNSKKNPLEQLFEDFPQAQYGASLEGSVNTMTGPLHEFRDGYLRAVKDTTFQSALKILRDKYSTGTHPMLEDQLTALVLYTHTFSFFSFRDFLNRELRGVSASASPALKELRVFILCLLGGLRHLPRLRVPCTVYHVLSEKELEQQQQQQQQQQSGNIFSLNYFATTTPEGVPLSYTDCKDNSTQGSSPDVSEEGGVVVVLKVCGYMCAYCIKEFTGRTEFVLNPSLALRMARTEKPYPKNPQLKMMEATATESCVVLDAHVRAYENAARKREALASSSTATAKATPPPEPGPYAEQEEGACLSRTKNTSLEEEYRTVPKTFYESFSSALVTANFGAAQRNGTSYKQRAEEAAADLLEKCSECLAYLKSSSVLERYSMCDEDAMSISLFTLDGSKEAVSPHSVVNELLCKRASIMGIRGYLFYLLNALRKIPPYPESEGPLYRGVCGLTLDSYTVGQKRTWPAFTSTYPEESMAEDRLSGPNQVLFEIHGKYRAYDIRDFSIYHDEVVLIEPDTTFIVKDIVKESPERTRIVVEVQERDVPVLNDAVKRFISNKPAETPQQTAITTAETTQNTKTATTKTLAVMRACYKEVFCPNVLTEEEFDAVTPFTTQSLLQKVFSSKAAQSIGFPGFLSRIFLGSSKLYRKHARLLQQHKEEDEEKDEEEDEEGTTETFCGEKTFVRDMLYIAIKAHNIVYSANRVELRVDVTGAGLKTEKNAMCWAKHVSQQLTAGLPHGTFAYNGACTYKGFSGNSFWMTMYAKTATNTQAVTPPPPSPETAAAATTTTIKTVVDAVNGFQGNKFCVYAKEFSLVLLGFSVPNVEPFSKYDVCPSVSKAITAAFHILADSVSYAPSAVPAGKNVVVALSSRDDADAILRNSSITLAGQRCKITECPTVRVPASPDVFCGEFGPSVYFLALSRDDRNGLVCGTVFDEVACSRLVAKVPSAVVVDDDDAVIPGQEEEEVAEKEKESQKSRPTSPWKTGVLPKSVPSQHAYLVSNKKI